MKGVLPTFLGIGVQRGGTTWLYELLKSHPDIYVPGETKEVHFFDVNYKKGIGWYRSFFPNAKDAAKYKAIGEVTPRYFHEVGVPKRVKRHLPEAKFILILRNPVERAYSSYGLAQNSRGYRGSFERYLEEDMFVKEIGCYNNYLKQWFTKYPKKQFLILIFEEMRQEPEKAIRNIAHFLNVDAKGFARELIGKKVNKSYNLKHPRLFLLAARLRKALLALRFDIIITIGRKLGIDTLLAKEKKERIPKMKKETKSFLEEYYGKEIDELEQLLARKITAWHRPRSDSAAK